MWKNYLADVSLKIAFVVNTSWNVFNFRRGLVQSFLKEGHEIVVITPKDEYVSKLNDWGVNHVPVDLDGTGMNPMKDLGYLNQLKKVLRKEKPDIILSFTIKSNIYGSLAAKSLKIPIVCNVSGLGTTFLWNGLLKRAAVYLYKRAFRSSSFVFFQNGDDRELFLEHHSH